jgi:CubicO group peptidase (beta-lactamase class C family)
MNSPVRVICFTILLSAFSFRAGAEDFTNAIHAFLQHRGDLEKTAGAIVVGIVDDHGSNVISFGKLDNGTDREADGDSLFNIYSSSCTFTGLLLQDMIERGQMNLDDPVAKYLPKTVKMPTHNGREITLRHLVTETSGFPYLDEYLEYFEPKRADNAFADFTLKDLYAFVSGYQLTRDPGLVHLHGSVDMGLLGQAIASKVGTNYEAFLARQICGPLKMDNTGGTLTPKMKFQFAFAHSAQFGYAVPPGDLGLLMPLCGLHSTANDLLKFVSANLGFTPSSLPPLMKKLMANFPAKAKLERERGIVESGGGNKFVGPCITFDKTRKRGVVVLCSSGNGLYNARSIGRFLLESEWQSDRRPKATNISSQVYGLYVGQYQRSPDFALGMFSMRQYFLSAPKAAICITAGFSLVLLVILWRAGSSRKRQLLLGGAFVAGGVLAVLTSLVWSHMFCARFQPRISIYTKGDRLFAQATGMALWPVGDWDHAPAGAHPIDELLPPRPLELLPQSETRFFERLSGLPVTYSRDDRGRVTGLIIHDQGKDFPYEKISAQPPEFSNPPQRPAIVKLDTKRLDACAGHYEQAPCNFFPAGAKVMIWREGDQLLCRISGRNAPKGAIEIYPESETNFFNKLGGAMAFVKNGKGEVTAVTFHDDEWPDIKAKKL